MLRTTPEWLPDNKRKQEKGQQLSNAKRKAQSLTRCGSLQLEVTRRVFWNWYYLSLRPNKYVKCTSFHLQPHVTYNADCGHYCKISMALGIHQWRKVTKYIYLNTCTAMSISYGNFKPQLFFRLSLYGTLSQVLGALLMFDQSSFFLIISGSSGWMTVQGQISQLYKIF